MLTFLTLIGVAMLVLWFAQRSLIYFPESTLPAPAAVGLSGVEPVSFKTEDDLDLDAWWVPARQPGRDRTIVVFNGNAGNRAHRAPLAALFAELGYSTLLIDYRGYGGNPGLPSERGLERDARGALRYLATRPDVDLSRLVYFGESLGAAVAVRLAEEHPPAALILRSPFSSLAAIGAIHYPFLPVRWFLKDRFASIDRIGRIRSPILFIAGDTDRIVPFTDSEQLYEAAREPKRLVVVRGADHNDEDLAWGTDVIRAIRAFLD
jgi:fermentation-respiration switch protein FrsA (DUF1100 family)